MAFSDISTAISDPQQFLRKLGASPAMIGDLVLDVVVREAPNHTWNVTEHKTESGSAVSDFRIKNPDVLVLDVVFVNKQYGVRDVIANTLSGEGLVPTTWRDKYEELKEVWANDEPVTVVTGLDSYANMVVQNVAPVRQASTAGSLVFTVTLREVKIVNTEVSDVDTALMPSQEETSEQKTVKQKQAKKKNKKESPTKPDSDSSTLNKIRNGGSIF